MENNRKVGYPLEASPIGLLARAYPLHGVPKEYNVSGILRLNPVRELTCNETILHLFASMCQINDGTNQVFRSRRALMEKEVAAAEIMNNNGK